MTPDSSQLNRDVATWVKNHFPDAEPKLLVQHPWADTWRFGLKNAPLYLKHIHGGGAQKVHAAMAIARAFQTNVPPVLAAHPKLSAIVVADHGGAELKSRTANMSKVLPTYAELQVQSMRRPFGSKVVPRLQVVNLYEDLLDFLAPSGESPTDGAVRASHFFGESASKRLHELFSQLRRIMLPHLAKSELLPQTINHCDLRPPNMALKDDGTLAIFDWDDATWGPAGLSLHAQFSGCRRPHIALMADMDKGQSSEVKRDRKHLDAYIDVFADKADVDPDVMRQNLSSSIVAGTIHFVLGFQHYPAETSKMRETIRRNIEKRLNSVLDVVELLAEHDVPQSKMLADAYFRTGNEKRFDRLQKRFSKLLIDIPVLNDKAEEDARKPGVFPAIKFSDMERDAGVCTPGNADMAARIYREHGAVLLENSLHRNVINECREYIFSHYDDYFKDNRPKDSLRVGNKRFMITLAVDGPINQPSVYAPPTVMPILERLLSDKMILGSLVAVTSLPGAKDQSRHRDHHALFPGEDLQPPPFATSVMIPLIDMNEEVGATRIFKGSHLRPTDEAKKMPPQDPVVSVGSCFLMDYRVQHMGMANKSKDKVRPVVTLIFQRPWFRDYVNYDNQERLVMPDAELQKIPEEHRKLFDWK